jgi:hypothetical protein
MVTFIRAFDNTEAENLPRRAAIDIHINN